MGAARMTVRRAALIVPRRDAARPFAIDLEDALRTASLPFGPGAVVRIRHLALGTLAAGISRQALAARIAEALGRLGPVTAAPGRPPPEAADAVVFADLAVAALLALDAIAEGHPMAWSLAACFPQASGKPAAEAAAHVLGTLVASGGPTAPGRLALLEGGAARLGPVLAGLAPSARIALLLSVGYGAAAADRLVAAAPSKPAAASPPERDAANPPPPTPDIAEHGASASAASVLPAPLRAALTTAAGRIGPGHPALAVLAALILRAVNSPAGLDRLLPTLQEQVARALTPGRSSAPAQDAPPAHRNPPAAVAAPHAPGDAGTASTPATAVPAPQPHTPDAAPAVHPDGVPSAHAGLWLLVGPLTLVGAPALDAAFDLPIAQAALAVLARRCGLPACDAAAEVLGEPFEAWPTVLDPPRRPAGPSLAMAARLLTHGGWIARQGRGLALAGNRVGRPFAVVDTAGFAQLREGLPLRRAPSGTIAPQALVAGTVLAATRLVRIGAGQPWRALARRPGRVRISATHLDVTFDARRLDPGTRLAGFDIDPGWVPWLGRVVRYHYDYSGLRDPGHVRPGP